MKYIILLLVLFSISNLYSIDTNHRVSSNNELTLYTLYAQHNVQESYNINGNSITSKSFPFLNLNYKRLYYFNDNFNIGLGLGFNYDRILHQFSSIENGVQVLEYEKYNINSHLLSLSIPLQLSYEFLIGKEKKHQVVTYIGYTYAYTISCLCTSTAYLGFGENSNRIFVISEGSFYSNPSQHTIIGGIGYFLNKRWKINAEFRTNTLENQLAEYSISNSNKEQYTIYSEGDIYKSKLYIGMGISYRFNIFVYRKRKIR